jgi:hypothetical protein
MLVCGGQVVTTDRAPSPDLTVRTAQYPGSGVVR